MQPQNTGQGQQSQMIKTPEMNEKDILQDMLSMEKYLANGYNVAVSEMSNKPLFDVQMQLLQNTHNAQRQIFDLMYQKGFYQIASAQPQQIQQKAQEYTKDKSQFPFS